MRTQPCLSKQIKATKANSLFVVPFTNNELMLQGDNIYWKALEVGGGDLLENQNDGK